MVSHGRQIVFSNRHWIAMMLLLLSSTQAGPVASAPLAKPLERAVAFVQLVDEMSDRGPRPLLAVFPDGRVASFDGATGRYSVARLNASGVATLLAELEFTARPAAGSRVAGERPSDVGVLQIAVGVTAWIMVHSAARPACAALKSVGESYVYRASRRCLSR